MDNTEEEIETIYLKLSECGQALMSLGDYGFSKKFGWLNDHFGVSWQLNLTK
jgi:predicted 3-demethylubiquinone-9 3-methyltransferase (glyoxalase superfamily)